MNRKRWFELDREKNGPITLFDFSTPEDAIDAALAVEGNNRDGWRLTDDSVIGGYSNATLHLIRTHEDYKRIINGQEPKSFLEQIRQAGSPIIQNYSESEGDNEEDNGEKKKEMLKFVPFIRWKGAIDTRVNEKTNVKRSGFCNITSPEFPLGGVDLGGRYNGLEIMCRSDGRPYSLNLKVESYIPDDLFQCFINVPATIEPGTDICPETGGRFDKVVLLFQHFIVTSGGRMRAKQRDLDNSVKVQSIGLTLMDGIDGNFEFDLARIRAVNYDESGVVGEAD
jgi:hypothetical protein